MKESPTEEEEEYKLKEDVEEKANEKRCRIMAKDYRKFKHNKSRFTFAIYSVEFDKMSKETYQVIKP